MTSVNLKSTKEELLEAYKSVAKQLKAKEEAQLNPEKVKTQRRKAEVVEKTRSLTVDGVTKSIETVRNRTQSILAEIEQEVTTQLGELATVQEALAARQVELQDIYGIEVEASGLAALVEAQKERRSQFDKELADRRVQFESDMANTRKAWEIDRTEYMRTLTLRNEQDKVVRDRELETSKYTFERDQKAKYDKLTDELATRTKAFEADMEQRMKVYAGQVELLQKREAMQKELETTVSTLQAAQTALQASIETKVATAAAAGKNSAQVGFGIEVNAIKKSYEADITVLKGQVTGLTAQVDEYRAANVALTNKLEAAYAKVQSVAEKALESQGSRQALAEVQRAVETGSSSKR